MSLPGIYSLAGLILTIACWWMPDAGIMMVKLRPGASRSDTSFDGMITYRFSYELTAIGQIESYAGLDFVFLIRSELIIKFEESLDVSGVLSSTLTQTPTTATTKTIKTAYTYNDWYAQESILHPASS